MDPAQQSLNNLMPNTNSTYHMSRQHTAINNVHQLPGMRQKVKYYHAATGLLMKASWLKAITEGFYATWPMLTTTAVIKYFLKLEETQKEHMWHHRHYVQSFKELNDSNDMHIIHMP